MKRASLLLAAIGLLAVWAPPVRSESQRSAETPPDEKSAPPLYRVTVVARTTKAINYLHRSGATHIDFRGTTLLPYAHGQARVESRRGAVRVQAQFDKLLPAEQFGPQYLTYVLWAISPEGRVVNLGEVVVEGQKSKVEATAELQAFGLIVTAEPYFAVSQPSDVVVMENVVRSDTLGQVEEIAAKFELLQRGQYANVLANFQPSTMDSHVPPGLYQARNAVQIAKGAGADHYAESSFQKAQQLLQQAESYQSRKAGKKEVETAAREAAQTAEDARAITVKRREEETLAQERKAAADREERANAEAERARLEAQLAAERAGRERAEAEAARAALEAEAQKAREAAERAAHEKAEVEAARSALQAEAESARHAAAESDRLRQQAEGEKAELRSRLLNQLNLILQTRDSARGLIVNMSDVLFDTGRYTLKPAAREKLAKISGIVLAHPGLNLQIEGHTDSVGSDEYNQQLSERRAGAVRDFLVQQGVPAHSATARGFGKLQPVASNDTGAGRQQNRRVELVVNGEAIGSPAASSATPPR